MAEDKVREALGGLLERLRVVGLNGFADELQAALAANTPEQAPRLVATQVAAALNECADLHGMGGTFPTMWLNTHMNCVDLALALNRRLQPATAKQEEVMPMSDFQNISKSSWTGQLGNGRADSKGTSAPLYWREASLLPPEDLGWVLVRIDLQKCLEWSRESTDNAKFYDDNISSEVEVWNTIAARHWASTEWLTHWMPVPKYPLEREAALATPGAQAGEWDARGCLLAWANEIDEEISAVHDIPIRDGCSSWRAGVRFAIEMIDRERRYAAGRAAANGPTCHKCGKLVETGDVLCTEHELEIVNKLVAERLAAAPGSLSEERVGTICLKHDALPSNLTAFVADLNALRQPAGAPSEREG